jgi:hypothetical protein
LSDAYLQSVAALKESIFVAVFGKGNNSSDSLRDSLAARVFVVGLSHKLYFF